MGSLDTVAQLGKRMIDPQPGDRVRATYEGVVEAHRGTPNLRIKLDNGKVVYLWRDRLGTLEVLEEAKP
jgi:hypothetical protein